MFFESLKIMLKPGYRSFKPGLIVFFKRVYFLSFDLKEGREIEFTFTTSLSKELKYFGLDR